MALFVLSLFKESVSAESEKQNKQYVSEDKKTSEVFVDSFHVSMS